MPKQFNVSDLEKLLKPIKDDLATLRKNSATKDDLAALKKNTATKVDLATLNAHNIRIEDNLDKLKSTVETKMTQLNSTFVEKLDPFLKRVQIAEDENVILQAKEDGRQEISEKLDARIKKLEDIHPNSRHQTP